MCFIPSKISNLQIISYGILSTYTLATHNSPIDFSVLLSNECCRAMLNFYPLFTPLYYIENSYLLHALYLWHMCKMTKLYKYISCNLTCKNTYIYLYFQGNLFSIMNVSQVGIMRLRGSVQCWYDNGRTFLLPGWSTIKILHWNWHKLCLNYFLIEQYS